MRALFEILNCTRKVSLSIQEFNQYSNGWDLHRPHDNFSSSPEDGSFYLFDIFN